MAQTGERLATQMSEQICSLSAYARSARVPNHPTPNGRIANGFRTMYNPISIMEPRRPSISRAPCTVVAIVAARFVAWVRAIIPWPALTKRTEIARSARRLARA